MKHDYIGTPHILVGLLREEKSFASQLLHERGLNMDSVREQVEQSAGASEESGRTGPLVGVQRRGAFLTRLDQWLAEREARGGIWAIRRRPVAHRLTHYAIYAGDPAKEYEEGQGLGPAEKLAETRRRLDIIAVRMTQAFATHQFEKARFYAEEERKERENLRLQSEQFAWKNQRHQSRFCASGLSGTNVSPELENSATITWPKVLPKPGFWSPNASAPTPLAGPTGSEFKGETLRLADPGGARFENDF